jgi:hypothetical protein
LSRCFPEAHFPEGDFLLAAIGPAGERGHAPLKRDRGRQAIV